MTIGADPEFFAVVGNNMVVSPAILEMFAGIKPVMDDDKHPVFIDNKEFKFHMDGVAFELGIKNPLPDFISLHRVMKDSMDSLEEFLSKIQFEGEQVRLSVRPVVNIDPAKYKPYIKNNRIYQGFIFGCDPDKDVFEDENYKCKTINVEKHLFRYGGGHFHFGNENMYYLVKPSIMLLLVHFGVFCVANSIFPDLDRQRVSTYGKPGRYRVQNYPDGSKGLEYRSPSNSWTLFPLEKYKEMEALKNRVYYLLDNPEEGGKIIENFLEPSKKAVLTYDQSLAKSILLDLNY